LSFRLKHLPEKKSIGEFPDLKDSVSEFFDTLDYDGDGDISDTLDYDGDGDISSDELLQIDLNVSFVM